MTFNTELDFSHKFKELQIISFFEKNYNQL